MPKANNSIISVYGTTYCADCHRARSLLDQYGIKYKWINIEDDSSAAEYVTTINDGLRIVPTIVFPDNSTLSEPSNAALIEKLKTSLLIT